ncbi:MAG: hypothetical protein SVY10_16600, partial [Thermodesulfobacteriota bacterium]|nr:hypothetical protein [Thermodesulfobacteriota bacterium]
MTALQYPESKLIDTQWNAFSRVDIVDSPAVRFAPGLSLNYLRSLPPQIGISVDGDSLNAITKYDWEKGDAEFTSSLPSVAAFSMGKIRDVLILEPLGGLDVLAALYHGATAIEGIERNPLIARIVKERYGEFAGNIYGNEKVTIRIDDGRAYLRSSVKKFDLIQIPISNTLGASSTGIYGLSEDYVFTEEAFLDYYRHLNENGFLSITQYLLPPPRTELRIISLVISSLEKIGIRNPEDHVAVMRSWGTITFLLKSNEITDKEILNLKEFCRKRRFDLVYYSGIQKEEVNIFNRFKEPLYYQLISRMMNREQREELYNQYLFNIRSVTDDKPFFYHFLRWNRLKELYRSIGEKWQPFIEGAYLIPVVFIQALILSIILIMLPLFLKKKEKQRTNLHGKRFFLPYFFFIGVGFMFIEIPVIQKFILFLGQPAYAVSTVLFAILVSAGIGSYLSERLFHSEDSHFSWMILILVGMIILYIFTLPSLFHFGLGKSLIFKHVFSILLLTPLGILMGMPFPLGIGVLRRYSGDIIPWAWCVNGCSSVLSAILAVMVAISLGYSGVLLCSAGAYLMSLTSMRWGIRQVRKQCSGLEQT